MKPSVGTETGNDRLRKFFLYFLVWTLVGLSFASQFYFSSSKAGNPVGLSEAVLWSLGDWYVFAILAVPVGLLAKRWPIEKPERLKRSILHLVASLVFSAAYVLLRSLVGQLQGQLLGRSTHFFEVLTPLVVKTWHFNLLIYWMVMTVVHALENSRKYEERERQSIELERGLVEARLQALQMQLNPHFLFNALHSVSALMHKNVDAADRMIARLGELLRYTLESSDEHEVTLEKELEILELYLDIEQTRFGSRLATVFQIESAVRQALVPNLILQPIVENSVRHGIEPVQRPCLIEVLAMREGAYLLLEVRDNGVGWKPGSVEGVGMSNTKARLRTMYGAVAEVSTETGNAGGSRTRIRFPFRTRSEPGNAG